MSNIDSPQPALPGQAEIEDRAFIDRSLAVTIGVVLKTQAKTPLKALSKGGTVAQDAALRDVVAALTRAISNQYEVGKLDANSRLYVTNYVKPRDPFDNHPSPKG